MQNSSETLWLFCDGASRGNPGPASYGFVIMNPQKQVMDEGYAAIGDATNNVAEYSALLAGLERAISKKWLNLKIHADSELMIRQLTGQYKVKSPLIIPLWTKAKELLAQFKSYQVQHIPREQNGHADRLANLALDQ